MNVYFHLVLRRRKSLSQALFLVSHSFKMESVDYGSLLQHLNLCTNRSQLVETADNILINLPQICHPSSFRGQITSLSEVDWVSHSIYPEDASPDLFPRTVIGDGNCLFRSGSVIVYGNESHHIELRLRTNIELLTNLEYYLNTNYMFNSDDSQLLFWLANYSASSELSFLNMNMISNCRTVLMDCIKQALNMNTWVGLWHVIALSSVLRIPIQSIYLSISVGISSSSNVRYVLNRLTVLCETKRNEMNSFRKIQINQNLYFAKSFRKIQICILRNGEYKGFKR